MIKTNSEKYDVELLFLGVVSPIYFLMVRGTQFIFFALIFVIVFGFIKRRSLKINIIRDRLYVLLFICSTVSMLSGAIFNIDPDRWKWQAIVFWIYNTIIFAFYIIGSGFSESGIKAFFYGFKLCAICQVIYGYFQYFGYTFFKLDLNQVLFGKILGIDRPLSHYNYGVLVPSGFSWHSGTLAPLLVILYCMSTNSPFLKTLILGIAALTQSSTCMLGVTCCVLIDSVDKLLNINVKAQKKTIAYFFIAATIGIWALIKFGMAHIILNEIKRLILRALTKSSISRDISSYYHKRYYFGLLDIAQKSNVLQLLFGYGEGCSGYPFVKVFGQYATNSPWVVESEIANRLLNRGIIGLVLTYAWLIRIVKKGRKISKEYVKCFAALFLESVTYNIGFFWVVVVEIMLQLAVKKNINIWQS